MKKWFGLNKERTDEELAKVMRDSQLVDGVSKADIKEKDPPGKW